MFNGNSKWHRSVSEVFSRGFPARGFGLRLTTKHRATREEKTSGTQGKEPPNKPNIKQQLVQEVKETFG